MREQADFPSGTWDGLSDNPNRQNLNCDQAPNSQDWDKIVVEVIAMQNKIEENTLDIDNLNLGGAYEVLNYAGTWTTNTIYQSGQVVTYGNTAVLGLYVCKQSDPTGNVLPTANATLWTAFGIQLPSTANLTVNTVYKLTINNNTLAWTL